MKLRTYSKKQCRNCSEEFQPTSGYALYCKSCSTSTLAGRLRTYNLTESQYELMLEQQKNLCPICDRQLEMLSPWRVHIDHDHATGTVRGILCGTCNKTLSEHLIRNFRRIVQYLKL